MNDFQKINIDEKLYKSIVKSLKNFGYESSKVKDVLQSYEGTITKENMSEVITWVIKHM